MTTFDRELKRGTLELLLLHLLADRPAYGYELVSTLKGRSGGDFQLQEGTLYPVLYRLEDAGLVVPEWSQPDRGVPRKYYRLTAEGRRRLESLTEGWRRFAAAVEAVLSGSPERKEREVEP